MSRSFRVGIFATVCALFALAVQSSDAGTILKLNLGSVSPDIEFVGGFLSTVNDANPATTGDQDTAILFDDFLDGLFADVLTSTASFSMDGLLATGPPATFGTLVIQSFTGGTIDLYSPSNALLLSGTLTTSAMTGTLGPPGSGGLFTTSFGAVTGGILAPYILPGSMTLSMTLSSINGGAGLSLAPGPVLNPFTADASVNIDAEFSGIPEPASALLLLTGAGLALIARRRR